MISSAALESKQKRNNLIWVFKVSYLVQLLINFVFVEENLLTEPFNGSTLQNAQY